MLRNRLEKRVAVISLLLGLVAGSYQYLPDINKIAFGSKVADWELGRLDEKALAKKLEERAKINAARAEREAKKEVERAKKAAEKAALEAEELRKAELAAAAAEKAKADLVAAQKARRDARYAARKRR